MLTIAHDWAGRLTICFPMELRGGHRDCKLDSDVDAKMLRRGCLDSLSALGASVYA